MAGVHHTGKRFRSVLCLEWEPRLSNGTPVRDIPTKLVGRVVEGAQRGRERLLLFDPLARRLARRGGDSVYILRVAPADLADSR